MLRSYLALLTIVFAASAGPKIAQAESVVATRTIRAQQIIEADAVRLDPKQINGAVRSLDAAIGRESRSAIYAGQPLMAAALTEPALIERNQIVELIYARGGLRISAEGRAMGRARAGEQVRVMNLSSRNMLVGTVGPSGLIDVSPE